MADVTLTDEAVGTYDLALSANTAKTVQFGRDLSEVKVANTVGTTAVYVAFLDAGHAKAATVGGTHCYQVRASTAEVLPVRTDGNTLVSLISSGATTVAVSAT